MEIDYTEHAEFKFRILKQHGFSISKEQVGDIIRSPQKLVPGRKGRLIAQKPVSETHMVRVVYEQQQDRVKVITFYPARRDRYEDQV